MTWKTTITGFLAIVYCVSAHFFMSAYTQYHVSTEKLSLFRGQERYLRTQTKDLAIKKDILERVQMFVQTSREEGFVKKQWDQFFVDLENEGLSFPKLGIILDQTTNSADYFYIPRSLQIRTGSKKAKTFETQPSRIPQASQTAQNNLNSQIRQLAAADRASAPDDSKDLTNEQALEASDAVITVEGHFLVRRGRGNG